VDLAPSILLYQPQLMLVSSTTLSGLPFDAPVTPETPQHIIFGREGRFRDVAQWYLRSAREIRGDLREP
jgi:peptide/nickel transport system substrate-binding protein